MRRLRSTKGPDICERTFRFGVRVIKLVRRLPTDIAGHEVGRQLLRSGTSVGANMEEADASESTDDLIHKLKISLKEAQETRYWLRSLVESDLLRNQEVDALTLESEELIRIINVIISSTIRARRQTI